MITLHQRNKLGLANLHAVSHSYDSLEPNKQMGKGRNNDDIDKLSLHSEILDDVIDKDADASTTPKQIQTNIYGSNIAESMRYDREDFSRLVDHHQNAGRSIDEIRKKRIIKDR